MTFSGHLAIPNFGHPFMFANTSTNVGGNDEKWGKPAICGGFAERLVQPTAAIRWSL